MTPSLGTALKTALKMALVGGALLALTACAAPSDRYGEAAGRSRARSAERACGDGRDGIGFGADRRHADDQLMGN